MAYDESVAERLRDLFVDCPGITGKRCSVVWCSCAVFGNGSVRVHVRMCVL